MRNRARTCSAPSRCDGLSRSCVTALAVKGVARVEIEGQITIDVLDASGAEAQRLTGAAGIAPPHDAESFALLRSGDHIAAIGADVAWSRLRFDGTGRSS